MDQLLQHRCTHLQNKASKMELSKSLLFVFLTPKACGLTDVEPGNGSGPPTTDVQVPRSVGMFDVCRSLVSWGIYGDRGHVLVPHMCLFAVTCPPKRERCVSVTVPKTSRSDRGHRKPRDRSKRGVGSDQCQLETWMGLGSGNGLYRP